jgi:hypothetical protein
MKEEDDESERDDHFVFTFTMEQSEGKVIEITPLPDSL